MHRDIKPENLLLKSKENLHDIVIADFGLATLLDANEFIFKQCGTPGFIAPEILHYKVIQRSEPPRLSNWESAFNKQSEMNEWFYFYPALAKLSCLIDCRIRIRCMAQSVTSSLPEWYSTFCWPGNSRSLERHAKKFYARTNIVT